MCGWKAMNAYQKLDLELLEEQQTWLITGVAGFIGSNLLEKLLSQNQKVIGLDNFITGYEKNLEEVRRLVTSDQWDQFRMIKGDIRNMEDCKKACFGVDYVLHQAALGSVPRSLVDPISTNEINVSGFLNMLVAARDAKVRSFTFAASSSSYGDIKDLPKVEEKTGKLLSPYAVTKLVNEIYAEVFYRSYGFNSIGLRYFNVFGPRQDPSGAYAAVIPKWINSLIKGEDIFINGDGKTSRDFTFVSNVVQANLLSALNQKESNKPEIINIAYGRSTTLYELSTCLIENLKTIFPKAMASKVIHRSFRDGDVNHSLASIKKAEFLLGYLPEINLEEGIKHTINWYKNGLQNDS